MTTVAGNASPGSADGIGTAATFGEPYSVAMVGTDVYLADAGNHTIRRITQAAEVTTYAGLAAVSGADTASGANGRFNNPEDVVVDANGNVFVADTYNRVIRKIPVGTLAPLVFAGTPNAAGAVDGDSTTARFTEPSGIALDGDGNLYVADRSAATIRKITPTGDVTTIAGTAYMYGSDNGNGAAARFSQPNDVAVDALNNVYVADMGNHTIRKITPAGDVTTLAGLAGFSGTLNGTTSAARFNNPRTLAIGSDGNLYVGDLANHTIRKVTMTGVVTTLAGQPGTSGGADGTGNAAQFFYPMGIAADANANLYVVDQRYTLRKVTLGGVVTTLAGIFERPGSEDGTGEVARFTRLFGVTSTSTGTLFLTDLHTLRRASPALPDEAAIDAATGAVGAVRQLTTDNPTGNLWQWSIVRRPAGSNATLSSSNTRTPTFTPDIPDRYTFRLLTALGSPTSITEVSLVATAPPGTVAIGPATLPSGAKLINFSAQVTASGGIAPYLFRLASGTLPTGVTLQESGAFTGRVVQSGSFPITIGVTDSVGNVGSPAYTLVIKDVPEGVNAYAQSATSVMVEWPAVAGATSYRVERRSAISGFTPIDEVALTAMVDTTAAGNTAYIYRIIARDGTYETQPAVGDLATTVMFTDPTLVVGTTPVRATHITQLRTAVNAVRALGGYPSFPFDDATLTDVPVRASHVTQLRQALAEARVSLSLPAVSYTDPTVTAGTTPIKAVHINQLRLGVR